MRKLGAVLMALLLILSSLPIMPASAEVACDADGFCFEDVLAADGSILGVKLRSYNGSSKQIDIPAMHNGKAVVEIGEGVFMKKMLKSVVIPDTVKTIGLKAFYFSGLTKVTLSSNLKTIASQAFSGNEITTITLPEGIESIEDFAFSYNELTFVELPKSLTFIGTNAFYNNELGGVKINSNLTYNATSTHAIFGSTNLHYIEFGENVTSFSQDFLKNLSNLPYNSRGSWYTDPQFKNSFTDIVTPEIKRIYANSIDSEYGVFYEANGALNGTVPAMTPVRGGMVAKVLAPQTKLTKSDANFLGWNTKADGLGEFYRPGDEILMPFHFIELFAHWGTKEQAVITAYLEKGPVHSIVNVGEKVVLNTPSAPYEQHFAGWYKDANLTVPFNVDKETVTGDLTLYPKFERNQYTIQFNTNGGTAITNKYFYKEELFSLDDVETSREGYHLEGWYTNSALTEKATAQQVVLDHQTYYAKWNKNEYYTITFETNGGSAIESYQALKGTMLDYKQFVPTKAGFDFMGWYYDPAFERPMDPDNSFVRSGFTLYAKWEGIPVPVVTFDVDGGQRIESVTLQFGQALGVAPIAVKPGYEFEGWYYDPQFTQVYGERNAVFDDVTLYAKFAEPIRAYINGFPDGTFKPDAAVTREQMALMVANILTNYNVPKDGDAPFIDTANSYAKDAINYVNSNGLMTGKTATTFDPQGNMTRAEMATVVARYEQKRCAETPNEYCLTNPNEFYFYDVAQNFWAKSFIQYVANMGAMRGYEDGSFRPQNNITRAESVKVLNQLFNRKDLPYDVTPKQFVDTNRHWAHTEIEKAATTYIIK